jgi:hypothetical protein
MSIVSFFKKPGFSRGCKSPTQDIQVEAAAYSLHVIGDAEDHTLMPLSSAKAWMHPKIAEGDGTATSSLRDALLPSSRGVRGPYGFQGAEQASKSKHLISY